MSSASWVAFLVMGGSISIGALMAIMQHRNSRTYLAQSVAFVGCVLVSSFLLLLTDQYPSWKPLAYTFIAFAVLGWVCFFLTLEVRKTLKKRKD